MFRQDVSSSNSSSGGNSSSGWKFVFEQFVFGIRLRGGIRLRVGMRLREFVFGICLRRGIRLRGDFVFEQLVFGIRLRNSSSSAGRNVIPAPRPQCIYINKYEMYVCVWICYHSINVYCHSKVPRIKSTFWLQMGGYSIYFRMVAYLKNTVYIHHLHQRKIYCAT